MTIWDAAAWIILAPFAAASAAVCLMLIGAAVCAVNSMMEDDE